METIIQLENEIVDLKRQIFDKQEKINELKSQINQPPSPSEDELSNDEISRYCRQVILPQIGVKGQLALRRSSVLVVGAGGLGCPALLYLASAGVGNLGIVDYDEVELNNLHRQTLHSEESLGKAKAISAREALLKLNSKCNISVYNFPLLADQADRDSSALELIEKFDVILDCTDNVATRYLLNDACVITGKPLVSGSALKFEGQLTVFNYREGPCYRCIFPTPPPPQTVANCGDAGVLGAVTGVIGSLQAIEAIKIILGLPGTLRERLLLFDASEATFRNIRLRAKRPKCDVCSDKPIIHSLINYEEFCGMRASDKHYSLDLLSPSSRISVQDYRASKVDPHLLIDVRSPNEFEICRLDKAINIPLKDILEDKRLDEVKQKVSKEKLPVFVVCRRGNDSQIAVEHLKGKLDDSIDVKDMIGGLHAWHYQCDKTFPIY